MDEDAGRKQASNRKAAGKLLQLRLETGLTQVDAATLEGDSSRSVGAWERGEVDMAPLRYFLALLAFRDEQKKGGR